MSLEIGAPAPEFELTDQHGQSVRLAEFRGKQPVALVFYPFAFSGICTGELSDIRDNLTMFETAGAQVMALSCDPMYTLRAYAEAEGYEFPLLSDFWPHGEVSGRYGVFNQEKGFSHRGSFLIDADGVLRWSMVNDPGQARPMAAYSEALAAL